MITQIHLIPALPEGYVVVNADPQSEDPEEFDMGYGVFWVPEKLADEFRFSKIIKEGGKLKQPAFVTKLSVDVAQLPGNRFTIEENLEEMFRAFGAKNLELKKTMWGTYPVLAISGNMPTGEAFARLWFGINSPNGWAVEIIFFIPEEEDFPLEKSMEMWETLLEETRLPPGIFVPPMEDHSLFEDTTGVIRLNEPPVRELGRRTQRAEGILIVTNDLGDYLRVEADLLEADAIANADDKEARQALLNTHFDTRYYPHTYGTIEQAKIISRNFVTLNEKTALVVGIQLPQGSILQSDKEGRLNAVRYVAVTLEAPFYLYVTIEFNELLRDLNSEELNEKALSRLQRALESVVLDKEALDASKGE
ncbi:MAG: hypothetical protein JJU29_11905 [Verrucomicrobia bacterium]|nr:hypothetical protein [Verrucomicrobiota bacterium]MCH8514150.1 hypothetical protein [Kiritimatiellia bacterium]